jgi:hypothetical protein
MLERSVGDNTPKGAFLSVAGLRFQWDPAAKPGFRVQWAKVRPYPKPDLEPVATMIVIR